MHGHPISYTSGSSEGRHTVPWFGRGADIYVADTAIGGQEAVTAEVFDNWWPVWSPDSEYLAFLSDRDGSGCTKIWIWNARNETLKRISDKPAGLGPIEWTPGGHQVIFSRSIESASAARSNESTTVAVQASAPTVTVYKPSTQEDSEPRSLAKYSLSVELVDIDSGEMKTIVQGQISAYRLSPDGSHLAFTVANRFEGPGSQQILFDFEIVDIKSDESRKALSDLRLDSAGSAFSWSPDGNYLCLRSSAGQAAEYFIVSASGGTPPRLMEHTFPSELSLREAPLWNESASRVYFLEEGELWQGIS